MAGQQSTVQRVTEEYLATEDIKRLWGADSASVLGSPLRDVDSFHNYGLPSKREAGPKSGWAKPGLLLLKAGLTAAQVFLILKAGPGAPAPRKEEPTES